jgi:hypothetical protein
MKKPAQHLIAEVPRRRAKLEMTIGVDLGDVWSHYCTLNQDGEVVDRGRFRTTPKAIEKWFTDIATESRLFGPNSFKRLFVSCGRQVLSLIRPRQLRLRGGSENLYYPCNHWPSTEAASGSVKEPRVRLQRTPPN